MLTDWGYEVLGGLPQIGESESHDKLALAYANAIVRNYCGWHVAPIARCKASLDGERYGHVSLPASRVRKVLSVKDDGHEVEFEFDPSTGMVRRADRRPFSSKWGAVEVEYEAGVAEAQLIPVVSRLVEMSSGTQGIRSETIGGASVTYADTEAALTDGMRAALEPYRLAVRP